MASAHNVGMWAMPADGKARAFCRILALCANSIISCYFACITAVFKQSTTRRLSILNLQKVWNVLRCPLLCSVCEAVPWYMTNWKDKEKATAGACADSVNRNLSLADRVHSLQWKVIRISGIFGILSLLSAQYQANKKTLIDSFQFCILGIPAQPEGTREALCLAFYNYLRTHYPSKALTLTQPQLAWYFFMWHLIS